MGSSVALPPTADYLGEITEPDWWSHNEAVELDHHRDPGISQLYPNSAPRIPASDLVFLWGLIGHSFGLPFIIFFLIKS